jgi:tRNA nucleotidyltransferase (CCA-adding enzyme)
MLDLLAKIGQVANEIGMSAYVVGGFVRDLMLYRDNEDLDIVIEGDGISFAKKYARLTEARVHTYEKFGTAVIVFKNGFKMDVASARMEYYQFPAALPTVEMSSIKLDLFRRDFTINTLAIQLNPTYFGTLIDFFSAQRDIKDKAIRVLHNLSFVEDPTRVFRAIRFEQRFDFTIGKLTEGLIRNAVRMDFFKRLSGDRVFAELKLILEEENPVSAINRLVDFDLLKVIHPALEHDNQLSTILESVNKVMAWHDLLFVDELYEKWSVYFLSIIRNVNRKVAYEICDRLRLSLKYQEMFCKKRFQAAGFLCWLEYYLPVDSSELYKRLQPFKTELILYMMASTRHEKVKRAISKYYTELRHIKIHVTGKDLREMGVKEGPVYREILQAILDAKLNGALKNEKEELEFLKSYLT